MEAGDVLRLFYTDGTTSSFLVVRFDEEAVFLKSPAGDHVLHHSEGRLDKEFEGKTLIAFAHIHPEHKTFKIGQKVVLTFGDEQVVGEIRENDDGLVAVLVNGALIYVDLVNPPKEFTSIRESEEALPETPYVPAESPAEAELLSNQLLHLYDKLLAEIPGHKQTFELKRRLHGVVRRYKQLYEEFSTPNMLPKTCEVKLEVTPWIFPIVQPIHLLYDDVRVTDHTDTMAHWVDAYQTAVATYTSAATGARCAVLDQELANLFRPFVSEGAVVPFQEGYALDVPVLHKTLRRKSVFVQHLAGDKIKVEGYVFLPEWVPFSRVVLPETPLLEKCVLQNAFLKYRRAKNRLDRHRVHRLLRREPPTETTALTVATAIQRLAPYGYNKDVVGFNEAAALARQVERNVAAYKKLLKRGTLERSSRSLKPPVLPAACSQERLFSQIAAAGQVEELPPQAVDLLTQLAEFMRGGLTVANAATVAAFVELHGRESDEPWVYFRDPAIKTIKFVPSLVVALANAHRDGTFAEVLEARLHSADVKVEDNYVVDRHSGYVLTHAMPAMRGIEVAEPALPLYALTDLPVAAAFRTLCDHAAVALPYEEYVVHRLRGVDDWVPVMAAYVTLWIIREGIPYANSKWATAKETVVKVVVKLGKCGVWPSTTETVFTQKLERALVLVAQDYKMAVPVLVQGARVEWASFLPPRDGPVGSCDAVHENVDSAVKGRIFACSVQVALLARKSTTSADVVHRNALIGNLSKRVRFPEAQLALCTATRDLEFAGSGKAPVDPVVEPVPEVELAAALNHFEVHDVSKLGDKLAANTAVIRSQLRSRKKGIDLVDDFILETGQGWVGAASLHRVLLNFTQMVAAQHDARYLKSATFVETDRVVPCYTLEYAELLTDLNAYYTAGEMPALDPRFVLVAKYACAKRNLTLAKFCLTSALALRGPEIGGFVRTFKATLKRLNKPLPTLEAAVRPKIKI